MKEEHMEGVFCPSRDVKHMSDHLLKLLCHSRWRLHITSSQPRDHVAQRKKLFVEPLTILLKQIPSSRKYLSLYLIMPSPISQPGKGSWFKNVCAVFMASKLCIWCTMLLNKFTCITAANLPHLALKIVVLQHILCSDSSLWRHQSMKEVFYSTMLNPSAKFDIRNT